MYPLSLIHRRKGSWLHMGSNPIIPTDKKLFIITFLMIFGNYILLYTKKIFDKSLQILIEDYFLNIKGYSVVSISSEYNNSISINIKKSALRNLRPA